MKAVRLLRGPVEIYADEEPDYGEPIIYSTDRPIQQMVTGPKEAPLDVVTLPRRDLVRLLLKMQDYDLGVDPEIASSIARQHGIDLIVERAEAQRT